MLVRSGAIPQVRYNKLKLRSNLKAVTWLHVASTLLVGQLCPTVDQPANTSASQ